MSDSNVTVYLQSKRCCFCFEVWLMLSWCKRPTKLLRVYCELKSTVVDPSIDFSNFYRFDMLGVARKLAESRLCHNCMRLNATRRSVAGFL